MADLVALSDLLRPPEESQAPGSSSSSAIVTPGSFGAPNKVKQAAAAPARDPKEIWDPEEVELEDLIVAPRDDRPVPDFDMYYKQDVDSGDVFLGTSDKTPGSQDCTHIVYKIKFPSAARVSDLDLDVKKRRLIAESRDTRLDTFLPMPVDHENGHAKWDGAKKLLTVTLPILLDEL